MAIFRKKIISLCFFALTGLTFLNMSFLLAEVAALKDAYGRSTLENIARMFSTSLAEEENDAPETSSGGAKVVDLVEGNFYHLRIENRDIAMALKHHGTDQTTHPGFLTIVTPPPDGLLRG